MLVLSLIKFLPIYFAACGQNRQLFGFIPTWYKYIDNYDSYCSPQINKFPDDLLPIGLAILDMLVRLAGFIAVILIIVAGASYIMAGGNAEKAATARKRLINAIIGLAIAMVATGFVAFIANKLT